MRIIFGDTLPWPGKKRPITQLFLCFAKGFSGNTGDGLFCRSLTYKNQISKRKKRKILIFIPAAS